MNLSAITPIEYSQGRLLQNNVKQNANAGCGNRRWLLHPAFSALGIVNARVYSFVDMLVCRFVLDKGFQLHRIFVIIAKPPCIAVPWALREVGLRTASVCECSYPWTLHSVS